MKKHLILLSFAMASVSLMADEAPFHIRIRTSQETLVRKIILR